MSDKVNKILISGGIGDFLQCLDAVILLQSSHVEINNKKVPVSDKCKFIVLSHYAKPQEFFAKFVKTNNFEFHLFSDLDSYIQTIKACINGETKIDCPRDNKFDFSYPYQVESPFDNHEEVIGIHPFGSSFSSSANKKIGYPDKEISEEAVRKILRKDKNYLLFGTKNELQKYADLNKMENVCLVYHEDIWVSLSHLQICSKLIAADSSFKTLSLGKGIPTYLIIGNQEDEIRDRYFINPYIDSDTLNLLKVESPLQCVKDIVDFVNAKVYQSS